MKDGVMTEIRVWANLFKAGGGDPGKLSGREDAGIKVPVLSLVQLMLTGKARWYVSTEVGV